MLSILAVQPTIAAMKTNLRWVILFCKTIISLRTKFGTNCKLWMQTRYCDYISDSTLLKERVLWRRYTSPLALTTSTACYYAFKWLRCQRSGILPWQVWTWREDIKSKRAWSMPRQHNHTSPADRQMNK